MVIDIRASLSMGFLKVLANICGQMGRFSKEILSKELETVMDFGEA